MLLGGLWHGANWTFVAWGAYHGILLAFERFRGKRSAYQQWPRPVRVAATFVLVLISWVLFRSANLNEAVNYLGAMIRAGESGSGMLLLPALLYTQETLLVMAIGAVVVAWPIQAHEWSREITWPKAILVHPLFCRFAAGDVFAIVQPVPLLPVLGSLPCRRTVVRTIIVAAVFLAVITAPGLIQTVSELRHGERPLVLDVFLQPPTARNLHAYEQSLEETSLVVKQLRPWMQYLEWRFLADAGEKAVSGRHGWLFYRPGVRYVIERQTGCSRSDSADPLAAIRSFRDQLQRTGIRLLVVPVPNKESVYPEMLARRAEGAGVVVCEQTRRLLDQLEQCGIEYVDLFEVFRRARQEESRSNPRRLYLAQDSHWSPRGCTDGRRALSRGECSTGGTVKRGDHAYVDAFGHRPAPGRSG